MRLRLLIAYDGSPFHGFAPNEGVPTVGGALLDALGRVLRLDRPPPLTCAGRTDTGVHAWGQVVHVDVPDDAPVDVARLHDALVKLLAPSIVVRAIDLAPDGFDARFSAQARTYRYTVLNRAVPDPFLAATSWWLPEPLDLNALRLACDPLIGEHDFSSFCRAPKRPAGAAPASLVRRVTDARWHDDGDGVLRLWISANAFCHQMVRSIVGTLVDAGRGRIHAGDVRAIVRARDRSVARNPAPPHGLCLWHVDYPDEGSGRPTPFW